MELRTTVMFCTPAFNTTTPQPHFINPGCYGDDLLRWMAGALRERGAVVRAEPEQEDFGWYLRFEVAGEVHCFVVGFRPDSEAGDGAWIGTVERSRGLLGSLFGRRQTGISPAALRMIHDVVSQMPGVSVVTWHHERDFRKGIEGKGASIPDQP